MAFRFIRALVGEVRAAVEVRRHRTALRSAGLVTTGITLVIVYIAASVVLVPTGQSPAFNFSHEGGAVTVLSAILLAMGCGFAIVSFLISPDTASRHRVFWLMMALVMGYFAVDELL